MIGIIDYGMGNVCSVESMINFLGYHKTKIIKSPEELELVDKRRFNKTKATTHKMDLNR